MSADTNNQLYQQLLEAENTLRRTLDFHEVPDDVEYNVLAAIVYMSCARQNIIDVHKTKVVPHVVTKLK